jgi:hypothetical protein
LLRLFEVRVEPSDGAGDAIAIVGGLSEVVAFVFVDDERRFDALRFQRVPEFVGLWRRAFAVAVPNQN